MAANGGEGRGKSRARSARNNNPDGKNQYSGMLGSARMNPVATAAAVGGAVAAGVFLWARRSQIGDQIDYLADQISEWREGMQSDDANRADSTDRSGRTQAEISEEALSLKQTGETA